MSAINLCWEHRTTPRLLSDNSCGLSFNKSSQEQYNKTLTLFPSCTLSQPGKLFFSWSTVLLLIFVCRNDWKRWVYVCVYIWIYTKVKAILEISRLIIKCCHLTDKPKVYFNLPHFGHTLAFVKREMRLKFTTILRGLGWRKELHTSSKCYGGIRQEVLILFHKH